MQHTTCMVIALCFLLAYVQAAPPLLTPPNKNKVYDSTWAVKYENGFNLASFEEQGFEVVQNGVGNLAGVALLRHRETSARHLQQADAHKSPSRHVTQALLGLPNVLEAHQQVKVQHDKRGNPRLQKKSLPSKRALPTDPLFSSQWHLDNTGQFGGVSGVDVNVIPVWEKGYFGTGVQIAIVDDGYQYTHPDLASNYQAAYSHNFNDGDATDPAPDVDVDFHGTSAAGVAMAGHNNGECGVGVAYNASGSGIRLISKAVTDATEADALTYMNQNNMIYSNSWGPSDDGIDTGPSGPLLKAAMAQAVQTGRGNKGSVYIWAAGNGGANLDNCNYDEYANSRFVTSIGALGIEGKQAYYSEDCAALIVTAPSSNDDSSQGIRTIDLLGSDGYDSTDCFANFGGTSSACPLVAGIVALMLQVNPNLGWRDIPYILATTAQRIDASDSDWVVNGAGRYVNHKYGFGLVDADAAVTASQTHTNLPTEITSSGSTSSQMNIPDAPNAGITVTMSVPDDITVERVTVSVNINHTASGDLKITLTSPSGTPSVLANTHGFVNGLSVPGDSFVLGQAEFGAAFTSTGVIGNLVTPSPSSGCGTISNCAALSGNIAYMTASGACAYDAKAKSAQNCGAIGVVMYSTDSSTGSDLYVIPGSDPTVTIPVGYLDYVSAATNNLEGSVAFLGILKYNVNGFQDWTFSSTRLLGESGKGTWTLTIEDTLTYETGDFKSATINVYGTTPSSTSTSASSASTSTSASPASSTTTSSSATPSASSTSSSSATPSASTSTSASPAATSSSASGATSTTAKSASASTSTTAKSATTSSTPATTGSPSQDSSTTGTDQNNGALYLAPFFALLLGTMTVLLL